MSRFGTRPFVVQIPVPDSDERHYNPSPAEVARRHGLDRHLATALDSIDAVTRAVVDR